MADYRLHATIISRSGAKSVVAAAAYRAGERILDERTGTVRDYTRKRGIMDTLILTPHNASEWIQTRARLWNDVEHREDKSTRRSTAQLARELQLSLPHELTHDQRVELVCDFIKKEFVEHGVVADIAFHAPPSHGDRRNYHAHVLLTLRHIGPKGFGKKVRLWEQQDGTGKRKSWQQYEKERLVEWRRLWAVYENRALEKYGYPQRVDHRRLEDQGIDREPTTHIGPDACEMERRGVSSDRAQQNRDIKTANDNLELAKKALSESEQRLTELRRQLATERMEEIQKTVQHADAVWKKFEARWPAPQPPPEPPPPAQPSQPESASNEPKTPPPPVPTGGGKGGPSMPDDLSEQTKLAAQQQADHEKQAQEQEQARQDKAAKDEADRLQKLRDDESKRTEDLARQNAERLAAQAEEMRQANLRADAQTAERAKLDAAFQAEQARIAQEDKRRQEAERQVRLEQQAKEGPIRNAGERYSQALGQHYDVRDHYATLAKSAMAEHAAFRRDQADYDKQIAKTADPAQRQVLDLRKRIEGADYLAITGDRIAAQSEIITGRRNSAEALYERGKAADYRIQAQDLRQQLRNLQPERTAQKEPVRERAEQQPEPARQTPPVSRGPDVLDEIITRQDDKARAKAPEPDKALERQQQQERERELQRKRDRER
jgi:hypothetical protein